MKENNAEKLGLLIDRIDNLTAGLELPMPAAFHIEQLKKILHEISSELKEVHFLETGKKVWD